MLFTGKTESLRELKVVIRKWELFFFFFLEMGTLNGIIYNYTIYHVWCYTFIHNSSF